MLRDVNLISIIVRTVLSLVIGGCLGIERERKSRPAGLRTYMLVCFGATLVMMTNQYVFQEYNVSDPVRLGAQVISGIGFLGAGTIMVTGRHQVKGLTTAASLWAAACCGLSIGVGFYEGAIIGGLVILFVMTFMERIDVYMKDKVHEVDLYLELGGDNPMGTFIKYVRDNNCHVDDIQVIKNKQATADTVCMMVHIESEIKRSPGEIVELIGLLDNLKLMEKM